MCCPSVADNKDDLVYLILYQPLVTGTFGGSEYQPVME